MATNKRRITITLTDRQYDVVKRMSDSSGQPMSFFISDLVEGALPTMEKMSGTFQQIRALQDDQRAVMLESMDKAQAAFGPLLEYIVETAGTALRVHESAVRDSSVVRSVASERSEEKADSSPLTNRGVTPSDENTRLVSSDYRSRYSFGS